MSIHGSRQAECIEEHLEQALPTHLQHLILPRPMCDHADAMRLAETLPTVCDVMVSSWKSIVLRVYSLEGELFAGAPPQHPQPVLQVECLSVTFSAQSADIQYSWLQPRSRCSSALVGHVDTALALESEDA